MRSLPRAKSGGHFHNCLPGLSFPRQHGKRWNVSLHHCMTEATLIAEAGALPGGRAAFLDHARGDQEPATVPVIVEPGWNPCVVFRCFGRHRLPHYRIRLPRRRQRRLLVESRPRTAGLTGTRLQDDLRGDPSAN